MAIRNTIMILVFGLGSLSLYAKCKVNHEDYRVFYSKDDLQVKIFSESACARSLFSQHKLVKPRIAIYSKGKLWDEIALDKAFYSDRYKKLILGKSLMRSSGEKPFNMAILNLKLKTFNGSDFQITL